MPKDFDHCVSNGGKVRTKTLKGGKYMHICIKDGKTHAGEVKTRKPHEGKKMMAALEQNYKKG